MSVDYQLLFNIAMGVAVAMGGWIAGRLMKTLDQLDQDVRAMPEKYVSKVDYREELKDIKTMLQRLLDKLDGKADKR